MRGRDGVYCRDTDMKAELLGHQLRKRSQAKVREEREREERKGEWREK